ncbi:PP2C family protein-serine/threonine phosphatase [Peterkaempfera sp. SMS 1(5)a]|uniref:PP2C family protein-serine/threonine phosphatase n=1 Tax=Peterkaempfera podocarpi TaxID=3232308 RepID=UPI003A65CAE1
MAPPSSSPSDSPTTSGPTSPRWSSLTDAACWGHLVRHPEPLRVDAIPRHPESVGFPEGHPRMRTLPGVAITVRGQLFGNLYLCDRRDDRPFDDRGWTLRWSTAGHMPPLVVKADSRTRYLHAEPGIPLGVDAEEARPDHHRALSADATLVLFTDGLVEHPRRSIDVGLDTLGALSAVHARDPLDELCRTLVGRRPSDGHDDMAVLGVRVPGYRACPERTP